jgi:hypothetical protein
MKVGKEEEAFGLVLHPYPTKNCAKEVAKVQVSGRLDA